MRLRALFLLAAVPFLAACENEGIAYLIDGKDHSIALMREQKWFWSDEVEQSIVVSRMPTCLRRYGIKPGVAGSVINLASQAGRRGEALVSHYCASKAAVGAITRCLAVEWAGKGIRVMNVAPGYIKTDLNADAMSAGPLLAYLEKRIPSGKPGTAADVGALVAMLFDPASAFMSGETIYIDGGQGIAH